MAAGSTGTTRNSAARGQAAQAAVLPQPSQWLLHHLRHRVLRYRAGTRRWLTVMRGRPPHLPQPALDARSEWRLRRLGRKWEHKEHAAWKRANHPPGMTDWLCIHRYEGSWTDSGGPYWGGLQMNTSFQVTYGGWLYRHRGTANHWSPLEQMWVAVRAWRVRGFSPWPNTARDCGLYG